LPSPERQAGASSATNFEARELSRLIGEAVGREATQDGQAEIAGEDALIRELDANIWEPQYGPMCSK
jgi:hypothetical protein